MKISGFSHNARTITKASKVEMPDFMTNKLVVKFKDDIAEIAVKIKRYWLGIPKTVKTSLELKSIDETKKAEVLGKFKQDVKALTEIMNYKYGTDPDSAVFSPW